MSFQNISYKIEDSLAYIGFGLDTSKGLTTLTEQTLKELADALIQIKAVQKDLKGLILFSHREGLFLAGADINLIASLKTEREGAEGAEKGQVIFNDIEDLKIPSIACVDGICLGGGLELSLACTAIFASNNPKTGLGLPEVKLGLIPGFGGTYRLPKKVSLPNALDMILSGKTVNASKAQKLGLVEKVFPAERLVEMAQNYLHNNKMSSLQDSVKEKLEHFASDNFISRKVIFQKARENVLKKTKGFYQAPLKILDVMETGSGRSRNSYLSMESNAFGELCISEQSQNLQHIFFMTDAAKKLHKSENATKKINRGSVLGAGTMGGGIAWLFAENNQAPIMKDLNQHGLELGLKQASSNFMGALKRRKITTAEFERKIRSITVTTSYAPFKRTDLVIEAVVENMDIKKKVFAELEEHVTDDCLITSNTSSLSVEEMATALKVPSRFAGLHFFNPVHRMPLVEIITQSHTSPETISALYHWALAVKKTPVVVKDGPGFLVNRILMPFINEAVYLLEEGLSISDLDKACLNFGMPMGACRLMDEVGIDVLVKVAKILYDGLGERALPSSICQKMVDNEWFGKKTGKGFYLYDESGKAEEINPGVKDIFKQNNSSLDEVSIQMRAFLPMINEAANILQDGIVATASDVDLGLIFGIGFPPFRGGLLRYADNEGLKRILTAIERFHGEVSETRYKPSEYLVNLVSKNQTFYS